MHKKALNQLEDFHHANMANEGDSNAITTIQSCIVQKKWVKPDPNFLKANLDAAIVFHVDSIGIGGVIQNFEDDVMTSFCIPKAPTMTLEVADALALHQTMMLCSDLGFAHVTFEGDCQSVVKATRPSGGVCSKLSSIIFDIQVMLQVKVDWSIRFDYRETNYVVHELAKKG